MTRNYLKSAIGDHINLLMAAGHFLALFPVVKTTDFANSLMEEDQIA